MINLTKAEARHLITIISDYMVTNPKGYLESIICVTDETEVFTSVIMGKLLRYATEPENVKDGQRGSL